MPTIAERISNAVTSLETSAQIHNDVTTGGVGATVTAGSETIPSIAKKINDIGAAILAGHNAGYLLVVANAAGRLAAQAGQAAQMLWQKDTNKLYIANSTTTGDFSLHPLLNDFTAQGADIEALQAWQAAIDPTDSGLAARATAVAMVAEAPDASAGEFKAYGRGVAGPALQTISVPPVPLSQWHALATDRSPDAACALFNTDRVSAAPGHYCAITTQKDLYAWGEAPQAGVLGNGTTNAGRCLKSPVALSNGIARPTVGYALGARRQFVQTCAVSGGGFYALDNLGNLHACGLAGSGVWHTFGSGVATTQHHAQAVYFNASGANAPVSFFHASSRYYATNYATLVAVDTSNRVWLMSSNPSGHSYSSSLSGAQAIPVNLTATVSAWSGKTPKKVRCYGDGSVVVLFTDKTLYGCCNANSAGWLNQGNTTNQPGFVLVASDVEDFELSGDYHPGFETLYYLDGTTLKGVGYNATYQLANGSTTAASSAVILATSVARCWLSGLQSTAGIIQKLDGTLHGFGYGFEGVFGNGSTANLTTVTALAGLASLAASQGAIVSIAMTCHVNGASLVVFGSGEAYATGYNTQGQLGIGTFANVSSWTRCVWNRVLSGEKIVSAQAHISSSTRPHFLLRTSAGRILSAGMAEANGSNPRSLSSCVWQEVSL